MRPIDLMIVGAPKSGTTSLKAYLAQHPELASHPQREFVFFTNEETFARGYGNAWSVHFGGARPQQALAAKSVVMMYSAAAMLRLRQHNPAVQVVVVLRDPVARAYSDYWNARRRGRETAATFEAAVRRCLDSPDADALQPTSYLARGQYARYIAGILDLFPRPQVSVIPLESLAYDPVATCQRLFGAVGVDAAFAPAIRGRENTSAAPRSRLLLDVMADRSRFGMLRNGLRSVVSRGMKLKLKAALQALNDRSFAPPPMHEDTRCLLAEYFEPWNQALAGQLGLRLDRWTPVHRRATP